MKTNQNEALLGTGQASEETASNEFAASWKGRESGKWCNLVKVTQETQFYLAGGKVFFIKHRGAVDTRTTTLQLGGHTGHEDSSAMPTPGGWKCGEQWLD